MNQIVSEAYINHKFTELFQLIKCLNDLWNFITQICVYNIFDVYVLFVTEMMIELIFVKQEVFCLLEVVNLTICLLKVYEE